MSKLIPVIEFDYTQDVNRIFWINSDTIVSAADRAKTTIVLEYKWNGRHRTGITLTEFIRDPDSIGEDAVFKLTHVHIDKRTWGDAERWAKQVNSPQIISGDPT